MVAVQIRDVPDGVRDALAKVAAGRGQSLQSYLLDTVPELVPEDIRILAPDEIARSSSGKIARRVNQRNYLAEGR